MARRSLRPQLNQIRTWVRQGRTDAWIAHQLEVTTQQIAAFKRENSLVPGEADTDAAAAGIDFDDEIDLRAEDDALIAAELEAAQAAKEKAEAEAAKAKAKEEAARAKARAAAKAAGEDDEGGRGRATSLRAVADAAAVAAAARSPPVRSRAPSTTATRATASGSTPPFRTTRSTPSTGPAIGPSRSRSKRTRS